jgi:hypothetical protein
MNPLSPVSSRRTGLAAAASLLLAAVSRPSAVNAQPNAQPEGCCGNGPPKIQQYGLGMQIQLVPPFVGRNGAMPDLALSYRFTNTVGGLDEPEENWLIFIPVQHIVKVTEYVDSGGIPGKLTRYKNVKDFDGLAFKVDPGFSLTLTWPDTVTPLFYTRPFGRKE